MRVFGCVCYAHVHEAKRTKLEERAEISIILGYSNVVKAYRVYNLKSKKEQISRDVSVDEKLAWNWEKQEIEEVIPNPVVKALSDAKEEEYGENHAEPEGIDHVPIRGTRTLQDVYQRFNVAMTEPASSTEAAGIAV